MSTIGEDKKVEIKDNNSNSKSNGIGHSETIDVNKEKSSSSDKTRLDFINDEEKVNSFIKTQTKKAEEVFEDKQDFKGKNAEEIRKEILDAEKKKDDSFKPEDYQMIAEFAIELLDTSLSNVCRFWGKDTAASAYSIPVKDKRMLTRQLTMIFIKYSAKFKIEFLFLLSVLMLYAPMFLKAKQRRNALKQNAVAEVIKEKIADNIPDYIVKETVSPVSNEEPKYAEIEVLDDGIGKDNSEKKTGPQYHKVGKDRKPGRQKK